MADLQTSIDTAAPMQRVWELVTDLERLGDRVDGPERLSWEGAGPAGTTARTTYSLSDENGGMRFDYPNEFMLPVGELGAAASGVDSGYAERETDSSRARLKQIAEG